jgi:hypothetical protein
MVATSRYAASVEDTEDEDDKKAKAKPKLATNGRYVILSESVIRSNSVHHGDPRGKARLPTAVPAPNPSRTKGYGSPLCTARDPLKTRGSRNLCGYLVGVEIKTVLRLYTFD